MRLTSTSLIDAESSFESWRSIADSINSNPSQYPEWTTITAKSHRRSGEVVTAYDGSELKAVLPIYCSARRILGFSTRTLELITNCVSYHNQPVTSLAPDALMIVLQRVAEERNADIIHLANIPVESKLGRYLDTPNSQSRYFKQSFWGDASPYLRISTTWEELLASRPKKFRYKLRKRNETLEKDPRLSVETVTDPDRCAALLDAIKHIEENSWKQSVGIAVFQRPEETAYYKMLLPYLAKSNAMFANLVWCNDEPIAYNLCCAWRGWVGQLKTSFDARYADLSPGMMAIDMGIRRAVELGATEFDFLGEADSHKLWWSKEVRVHKDYFLYMKSSFSGRLIGRLKTLRSKFVVSANEA